MASAQDWVKYAFSYFTQQKIQNKPSKNLNKTLVNEPNDSNSPHLKSYYSPSKTYFTIYYLYFLSLPRWKTVKKKKSIHKMIGIIESIVEVFEKKFPLWVHAAYECRSG